MWLKIDMFKKRLRFGYISWAVVIGSGLRLVPSVCKLIFSFLLAFPQLALSCLCTWKAVISHPLQASGDYFAMLNVLNVGHFNCDDFCNQKDMEICRLWLKYGDQSTGLRNDTLNLIASIWYTNDLSWMQTSIDSVNWCFSSTSWAQGYRRQNCIVGIQLVHCNLTHFSA